MNRNSRLAVFNIFETHASKYSEKASITTYENPNALLHTYILYCYLPNGALQEQLFKLLTLLITIQLKLIKFEKHLQH